MVAMMAWTLGERRGGGGEEVLRRGSGMYDR